MVDNEKLREALSFGVRTGDLELMAAVYKTEFEELEGQIIESDNGPKVVPRTCVRCSADFHMSHGQAETVHEQSSFNICQCCLDKICDTPEKADLSPGDQKWVQDIFDEVVRGKPFE